jgi:oligopeptide/dipeptide ABC transporter ATP-binding protein
MYAGAIVEEGPVDRIFERPSPPYTRALLRATPALQGPKEALTPIPGQIPLATERPEGCRFVDRCALAIDSCRSPPPWVEIESDHRALCIRAGEAEIAA